MALQSSIGSMLILEHCSSLAQKKEWKKPTEELSRAADRAHGDRWLKCSLSTQKELWILKICVLLLLAHNVQHDDAGHETHRNPKKRKIAKF